MRFKTQVVPSAAIDLCDGRFRISTDRPIADLIESMKLTGLMHAPLLVEKTGKYQILSGFRRIQAARYLGWPDMPARVALPGATQIEWAQVSVADNSLQRRLNLIEISRALNLLSNFILEDQKLSAVAASLALPANPKAIKKYRKLCRLPQLVQELIAADVISLSIALDLEKLPQAACITFAEIFSGLQLSLGKQREIFTLANEIALREEKYPETILAEPEISRIRCDENLDRAQKNLKIRTYLRKRRFPELSKVEEQFKAFIDNLPLEGNFKIAPPPGFEGTEHAIQLRFNSLEELVRHHSVLTRLIEDTRFKRYLSGL